jgi:ArsR family transcriptional regulator
MQNCLDAPQSTISQHLQRLRTAGIIEGRRVGLEIYYSVCNEKIADLIDVLLNKNNGDNEDNEDNENKAI